MIHVEDSKFSDQFNPGDGIVTWIGNRMAIFYSQGITINSRYLVGKFRFIKDKIGNREFTSSEQHKDIPEAVYGQYRDLTEEERSESCCSLNGVSLPWEIIRIDDLMCVMSGRNTFEHNSKKYEFAEKLLKEFPNTRFAEVGSSNIGLSSAKSDIDIYVYDNYGKVANRLRETPERFGLCINQYLFGRDVERHRTQYGFSQEEAERICHIKQSGLEFEGRGISFFDASKNPDLELVFQPNCSERVEIEGEVENDVFAGHYFVCYGVRGNERYSIALVRGVFGKEKRYVLKKEDGLKLEGRLVRKHPNVIIADDLYLTK